MKILAPGLYNEIVFGTLHDLSSESGSFVFEMFWLYLKLLNFAVENPLKHYVYFVQKRSKSVKVPKTRSWQKSFDAYNLFYTFILNIKMLSPIITDTLGTPDVYIFLCRKYLVFYSFVHIIWHNVFANLPSVLLKHF